MMGRRILPAASTSRRRVGPRRRGASAVELALILPLLITIVLGCVDFGRFASTYIAVTNAARVAAGFGSLNPVTSITKADWDTRLKELAVAEMGSQFDPTKVTIVSPMPIVEADGLKRVQVTVSYRFETVTSWHLLPNGVTLTRKVEMRVIR